MNPLKLQWGDPAFLSGYWKNQYRLERRPKDGLLYDKNCGLPGLKDAITALHEKEQNAVVDGRHIVVTNGATQALIAAIYALEGETVCAPAPYYPKFPNHATIAGKLWLVNQEVPDISIITTPNNPDGDVVTNAIIAENAIYDLCYNWRTYTNAPFKYNKDVMIFGLAKAMGMAGTRIGWAIVKDEAVAETMKKFIEWNTCDVSQDSQDRAEMAIRSSLARKDNVFAYGRKKLRDRWLRLRATRAPIENEQGMFIWSKDEKFWTERNIIGYNGSWFGATDEYVRLNLGCSDEDFEELMRRISKFPQ